jgi:hypothetical protein
VKPTQTIVVGAGVAGDHLVDVDAVALGDEVDVLLDVEPLQPADHGLSYHSGSSTSREGSVRQRRPSAGSATALQRLVSKR